VTGAAACSCRFKLAPGKRREVFIGGRFIPAHTTGC